MLIRSQNKKVLIDMSGMVLQVVWADVRDTEKLYKVVAYGNNQPQDADVLCLGLYTTEEKAILVLNMLENACYEYEYAKFMGCERENFKSCIFDMPLDSEVPYAGSI